MLPTDAGFHKLQSMRTSGIIIVNYRTPALVVDCLCSLAPEIAAEPGVRVVVVDNRSGDDSLPVIGEAIRTHDWAGWCTLLAGEKNGGFSWGNNLAIRRLQADFNPDYIHLLNPDTMVRPGAVSRLLDFLESRPDVGIAGSRLLNVDGSVQRSAFRFHGIRSEIDRGMKFGPVTRLLHRHVVAPPPRDEAHVTDWVSGASMLIRREVFDAIGLLDEGYFLYYEETDFCLRAARAGFAIWYVPESQVVHLEGASTGITQTAKRLPRYWFASRRRYFRKNHSALYEFLVNGGYCLSLASWRVRRRVQRKPDNDPKSASIDYLRFALWPFGTKSKR